MRRLSAAIIAALLAVGLFAPASFAASPSTHATKAVPKVVFVVGSRWRRHERLPRAGTCRGRHRAAATRPDVVELYSPNATWPAVREALQGASLVVYMGHGNGWPSQLPRRALPADPERVRAEPGGRRRRLDPPVLRRGRRRLRRSSSPRTRSSCSTTCATPAATPSPGCPRARSTRRTPAGRQLRRRLHPGRRVGGHRRGLVEPVVLRARRSSAAAARSRAPGRTAPSANGHRLAFESAAQPGLRRPDGHRDRRRPGFTRSIVMKAGLAPTDVLAGAAGVAIGRLSRRRHVACSSRP